ncbi:hypothetical protein THAOC_09187, partial [Thalassiosira oceanica]
TKQSSSSKYTRGHGDATVNDKSSSRIAGSVAVPFVEGARGSRALGQYLGSLGVGNCGNGGARHRWNRDELRGDGHCRPCPSAECGRPAGSATSGSSSSRAMYSESSTQNLGDRDQTQQINETKKKDDGFDEDEIQVRPSSPPPAHGSDRPVLASYNPTKASEEMYEESLEEHSRTASKIRAANARGAMEADAERSAAAAAEREPRWIQYETSAAVKVANMNAEYKSRSKDEGLTMEDRLAAMALENSRKAPASDGEGGTEDSINPYKQSVDSVGYKVGEYSFEDDYETAEYETSQYKSVYD